MQNFSGCRRGRRRISSGLCSQMLVTCFAISVIHNFVADIYIVVTREISTVSVSPQQNELRVHVLVQLVWKFIRPPPPTIVIIRVKSGCERGALGDAARSSEFSSTNEPKMLCYFWIRHGFLLFVLSVTSVSTQPPPVLFPQRERERDLIFHGTNGTYCPFEVLPP